MENPKSTKTLVSMQRFLKAMLDCAPAGACDYVINSILRQQGDPEKLLLQATFGLTISSYPQPIVRVSGEKTPSGITPKPDLPIQVEFTPRTAKYDQLTREHDGYRTSVTHLPLIGCLDVSPEESQAYVELAHIIPWSTISRKKDADELHVMWGIIQQFGGIPPSDITGRINEPFNRLVMTLNEHHSFDRFDWCLIPDPYHIPPIPHCYMVRVHERMYGTPMDGTIVTFLDHQDPGDTTHLPDPWFLRLHAAVAGIIHMSGATEYIAKYLQDL
ncbi:hypothetical protein BS47DRAFT_1362354 [Hydnum rufescens UP504]|uniref:HNH nuclease domain-containing protein n=1 Tax=Hydnum rufescens UP504 TaxID=1448309 RepID=A0A9P6AYD7_9AGAM|nr:hypothetical protein BS47DRAFT_1362354 [Hydnum rufescens UP504]